MLWELPQRTENGMFKPLGCQGWFERQRHSLECADLSALWSVATVAALRAVRGRDRRSAAPGRHGAKAGQVPALQEFPAIQVESQFGYQQQETIERISKV